MLNTLAGIAVGAALIAFFVHLVRDPTEMQRIWRMKMSREFERTLAYGGLVISVLIELVAISYLFR